MPDRFDTRVLHEAERSVDGAASLPIFRSTVWELPPGTAYRDIRYPRLNNLPNQTVVATKIARLEGYEAGLVTASGMSAILATLAGLFRSGDHLLVGDTVYGGTHSLVVSELAERGIEVSRVDGGDPSTWEAALRPTTRGLYLEPLTNPLLSVADLAAIAPFCRGHGLTSVVDNTFASPVFFQPGRHGIDVSLHSATKYLNGHSDVAAGVISSDPQRIAAITKKQNLLGGSLDPQAAWLLHRGTKTLGLRVRHQAASALRVARWLAERPEVAQVNHPGLSTHPQHALAGQVLSGHGACFSFTLEDASRAEEVARGLRLFVYSASLGGVESLVVIPAKSSHAGMSAEDRAAAGISDGLIRVSIGLEDPDDLLEDLAQALS